MSVLTLYFAGSGHGITSEDDSVVAAFKATKGDKAFFPGPGGANPTIYAGVDPNSLEGYSTYGSNIKPKGWGQSQDGKLKSMIKTGKRSGTGKGWQRNIWYAIKLINEYLKTHSNVTMNFVGHSRGSITIIMLLNDLFFHQMTNPFDQDGFSTAGPSFGKQSYDGKKHGDFTQWYEQRLKNIWISRMGNDTGPYSGWNESSDGIRYLHSIRSNFNKLVGVNAFLFDPVAGTTSGSSSDTSRKQNFPRNPKIKRVRVLRMESGGKFLSGNLPRFKNLDAGVPTFNGTTWDFLTGEDKYPSGIDLCRVRNVERFVIPMPGSHGAGLSKNKGDVSKMQQYLGTSYMVKLITECGTVLDDNFKAEFNGDNKKMLQYYLELLEEFESKLPGASGDIKGMKKNRQAIHSHHTKDGYAGGYINAHHRYLDQQVFGGF